MTDDGRDDGRRVSSFVETAALFAVVTENTDEARRLLGEMLPGELAAFADQVDTLSDLIVQALDGATE